MKHPYFIRSITEPANSEKFTRDEQKGCSLSGWQAGIWPIDDNLVWMYQSFPGISFLLHFNQFLGGLKLPGKRCFHSFVCIVSFLSLFCNTLDAQQQTGNIPAASSLDSLYSKAVFGLNRNSAESVILADSLRILAKKLKDPQLEFQACSLLGEAYFYKRNFEKAIDYFSQCRRIALANRDTVLLARAYNSLGIAYANWDYSLSLKYYDSALVTKEGLADSAGICAVLNNIGTIYDVHIKDYKQAFKYYQRSYFIELTGGDAEGIATSLLNMGDVNRKMGNTDFARELLIESLKTSDSAKLPYLSELACESLYKIAVAKAMWKEALEWHTRFTELRVARIEESQNQRVTELEVKYKIEEQSNQIRLLKSTQLINERERRNQQYVIYLMAVMVIGIFAISWILFSKSRSTRKANKLLALQHQEIQKQQKEMVLQAEMLERSNEELLKLSVVASKTDNMVVVARADGEIEWVNEGFTRILGIDLEEFRSRYSGNLFEASLNPDIRGYVDSAVSTRQSVNYSSKTINRLGREIWFQTTLTPILNEAGELTRIIAIDTDISKLKVTERELGIKQGELMDSIRYAHRIQVSMFPSSAVFTGLFREHFIFYRPRDIVSGDFYWLLEKDDLICLAAADCTGHGVPGAFMSVIGISLLNEVFHNSADSYGSAAGVLTQLRKMVRKSLSAGVDSSEMHDGMDFSLCLIDRRRGQMQFAGAYHSVFIARSDGSALEEIKGDKMPVGDYPTDREFFTNILVPVKKDDIVYLQSDGFWHQMGGPLGKKYGKRRYAQLLRDVRAFSLPEQKILISEALDQWMEVPEMPREHLAQMDDIMIVACRL